MISKSRRNISVKESLNFFVIGGILAYFVSSIPLILFRLFPPKQPEGIHISFTTIYPPKIYAFILGFGVFALIGIYLLQKSNLKNRLAYFSILSLFLSIGGGLLTSFLEAVYWIFIIGDSFTRESFFSRLQESYFETIVYHVQLFRWAIVFFAVFAFFAPLFLITSSLITKFKNRNSLK